MDFIIFRDAVSAQLDYMIQEGKELFVVGADKDFLWDTYLGSFPEGTNPIFVERTEHDCNCCKNFIRNAGSIVTFINDEMVSLWDIDIGGHYQVVADALAAQVRSYEVTNVFRHWERKVGTEKSLDNRGNEIIEWTHFYYEFPSKFVMRKDQIPSAKGDIVSNREVLERSIKEISSDAIDIVLELIAQGSLYRGDEHKRTVETLKKLHKEFYYKTKNKEAYLWNKSLELKGASKIRNTVIGTLLTDLTDEVDLEKAVKSFEAKVAPHNYKRPKALVTKGMIDKAEKKVAELGIEDSLYRRYAVAEDLTVNNVLFADRSAKKKMAGNIFDDLKAATPAKVPNLDKVQEIGIKEFVENVLPGATSLEVMMENKHTSNLVSLIAPVVADSPNILKWGNNFSWSYNGEVADSVKERVKNAGGNVDGYLRCSLSWFNTDDLDIHVIEPSGNHIFYANRNGKLDVDMNAGGRISREPVENVTWASKRDLKEGTYKVIVNNFRKREYKDDGFEVELEFEGTVTTFAYDKSVANRQDVPVVTFKYDKESGIKIIKSLPSSAATKEVWGVSTNNWQKVSMVMNSPNHWDGEETGNKHWFFMLEGCANPETSRGFYNEYLSGELNEHRKVFEVLGSKLRVEESENQLSGLGFSSTQSNHLLCKVGGNFNRVVKIKF